jgi:hypothetical protein
MNTKIEKAVIDQQQMVGSMSVLLQNKLEVNNDQLKKDL